MLESEVEDEFLDSSPYRIVSFPADYTLRVLHEKWRAGEIEIPAFQRQYVWTAQQASRLIESFLLGLPVPGIFLYKQPDQHLLVIDGQQRLKTAFAFFDNKFPGTGKKFSLQSVRSHWDGKAYKTLDESDQIRLRDAVLRATIIEQIDPKDHSSMFHIFERLNTGGTSLRPQEIRNCIYHGSLNSAAIEWNSQGSWRRILGSKKIDKRMRDVELTVRFLALTFDRDNYTKPMNDFLSRFMDKNRNPSTKELEKYKDVFSTTCGRVVEALGDRPFHVKAGLNAAVMDSVMVAFARHPKSNPKNIQKRYRDLVENESYQLYTSKSTTDTDQVKQRIGLATEKLFKE
jgi:uncharacterized protein with ParB-like and HNH nuclease domain